MRKSIIIISLLLGMLFIPSVLSENAQGLTWNITAVSELDTEFESAYTTHESIVITSNDDFASQGFPGSGTENDPYRIEGFEIHTVMACIEIRTTDAYFVIEDCLLLGYGYNNGISFSNVTNGRIVANTFSGSWSGVRLSSSSFNTLANNTFYENTWSGVSLDSSSYNTLRNNTFEDNSIVIIGSTVDHWKQNITLDNTVHDRSIGYFWNLTDGIVDGSQYGQIILANCTGVTIRNCEFYNTSRAIQLGFSRNSTLIDNIISECSADGVALYASWNNTLMDNTIYGGGDGVQLDYSSNNTLANNIIFEAANGMTLSSSSSNVLMNNTISGNRGYGLRLSASSSNSLTNNVFENNGIVIRGNSVDDWKQIITLDNTVNQKSVGYFWDLDGGVIDTSLYGQIILANCVGVTIGNGTFYNASLGIQLGFSTKNILVNNTVFGNMYRGVVLHSSWNNTLMDNTISGNRWYGIELSGSSNNTLVNNQIVSNHNIGVLLDESCSGNLLYLNVFALNYGINAIDNGAFNQWNSTAMGNSWDDYDGYDSIYLIFGSAESIDYHPTKWVAGQGLDYFMLEIIGIFAAVSIVMVLVQRRKRRS